MLGKYSSNGSANQNNVYARNGLVYYYAQSSRPQYITTNCIRYYWIKQSRYFVNVLIISYFIVFFNLSDSKLPFKTSNYIVKIKKNLFALKKNK